jgi:hypothetical protein
MIKRRCLGNRFPTLIASGEMSSSQMRCHNYNQRLQPPKRQKQGKRAYLRFAGESLCQKRKSKVGSHCFSSLFRKQLRLFNETSRVNLAYLYDAIVSSKYKRFSDRLSSFSCRPRSPGGCYCPVREPLAVLGRQVQADAHFNIGPRRGFFTA